MTAEARKFLEERINKPAKDSPSPVGRWLEGVIRDLTDRSLTFEFEVREEMTNPFGVLHGGMIGAIADDVIGAAVFGLADTDVFASVDLNLNFLSAVEEDETVIAEATLLREGDRVIHAECEIRDESGETVARATSNILKKD